jgi:hypothetical protein
VAEDILQKQQDTDSRSYLRYSRVTSTKSLSFCMTTCSVTLTNPMGLLLQSHNCSYYLSICILAPPPLLLQEHTDICPHDFMHSPNLRHQPGLTHVTSAWSWKLCGIYPAIFLAQNVIALNVCDYSFVSWQYFLYTSFRNRRTLQNQCLYLEMEEVVLTASHTPITCDTEWLEDCY